MSDGGGSRLGGSSGVGQGAARRGGAGNCQNKERGSVTSTLGEVPGCQDAPTVRPVPNLDPKILNSVKLAPLVEPRSIIHGRWATPLPALSPRPGDTTELRKGGGVVLLHPFLL